MAILMISWDYDGLDRVNKILKANNNRNSHSDEDKVKSTLNSLTFIEEKSLTKQVCDSVLAGNVATKVHDHLATLMCFSTYNAAYARFSSLLTKFPLLASQGAIDDASIIIQDDDDNAALTFYHLSVHGDGTITKLEQGPSNPSSPDLRPSDDYTFVPFKPLPQSQVPGLLRLSE